LQGLAPAARKSLWRSGLLQPGWLRKLGEAPDVLIQFIRSFSRLAGFEHVVKSFFGNRPQKFSALMAIQLARSIVSRKPGAASRMIFFQDVGYGPGSVVYMGLQMELDGCTFILLPWTELNEQTVRKLSNCHRSLFGDLNAFRWVFSERLLGMQKEEVVNQLKNILETEPSLEDGVENQRWEKLVIVLP
jgi:hypothetical protein